jgi:hypothetical protein
MSYLHFKVIMRLFEGFRDYIYQFIQRIAIEGPVESTLEWRGEPNLSGAPAARAAPSWYSRQATVMIYNYRPIVTNIDVFLSTRNNRKAEQMSELRLNLEKEKMERWSSISTSTQQSDLILSYHLYFEWQMGGPAEATEGSSGKAPCPSRGNAA